MLEYGDVKRRRVIKLLGAGGIAGIGGCTAPSNPDHTRTIRLSHVDSLSSENILQLDVSVMESQVTENHPARIQVTLRKEEPPDRIQVFSGCPQFHEENDWVSIPQGVLLTASDDPNHRTTAGPRWVLNPPPESAGGDPGCVGDIDFSDGPFRVAYSLYDDGRESGYLEPGFYTFSHDFTWIPVESRGDDSVDRVLFMLEFGLTIEN